jgi:hypothetical protein
MDANGPREIITSLPTRDQRENAGQPIIGCQAFERVITGG